MILRKLISAGVVAGAVAMTGVPAHAQSPDAGDTPTAAPKKKAPRQTQAEREARFKAADQNGDGGLTRDEAKTFPAILRNFEAMDANKDGKVTMAERETWIAERRAKRRKQ